MSTPPPAGLAGVLDALEKLHGEPPPPPTTEPLELVLWENVAYLADDRRREDAFAALKKRVGTRPERILSARREVLLEIAGAGIVAGNSVDKLRRTAAIALEQFGGDLRTPMKRPLSEARRALMKFPSIGAPGADKILLLSRSHPVLGLDSNGLRVLLRLGYGREAKSYAASYRSVQEAVAPQLKRDCDWLIRAHLLLRRHGQTLCRRKEPRCEACPVVEVCPYGRAARGADER
jgi:endonuclease-3